MRPAFLIGSAADSDLMLGAEQFPTAHCYLMLNPEGVGLRWLGFAPEMRVNDRPVEKAALQDGDILRTGPYEFRIRIRHGDTVLRLSHPTDAESDRAGVPSKENAVAAIRRTCADSTPNEKQVYCLEGTFVGPSASAGATGYAGQIPHTPKAL